MLRNPNSRPHTDFIVDFIASIKHLLKNLQKRANQLVATIGTLFEIWCFFLLIRLYLALCRLFVLYLN